MIIYQTYYVNIHNVVNNFLECSVTIASGLSAREPVFLKQNGGRYELWSPNGAALTWTSGQATTIACAGSGNSLSLSMFINHN